MFDKFREECGVFGIFGHPEAAKLTYLGLYALQHRGRKAPASRRRRAQIRVSKAMGYVNEPSTTTSSRSCRAAAIGHVRYSTAGESGLANAQPLSWTACTASWRSATTAISSTREIARRARARRRDLSVHVRHEVVVHLFARSRADNAEAAFVEAISQVRGAFSFVAMTRDRLIGVRDPHGFRPLAIGKLMTPAGEAMLFARKPAPGLDRRDLRTGRRAWRGRGGHAARAEVVQAVCAG
jgi:amidophosphoribosyltransferase